MSYNYENCMLYPECISVSADAAVFNVDIYHKSNDTDCTKIGKANVIVSRSPDIMRKTPNIALMLFNGKMENSHKLQEIIIAQCAERCKVI